MSLVWLTAADIRTINAEAVARTGEPYLVRDEGLLESARARPLNQWHYEDERDLVRLAATLLFESPAIAPSGKATSAPRSLRLSPSWRSMA